MTNFNEYPQDFVEFHLTAEDVVHNDTVRVDVRVNALVSSDKADADVKADIKKTLRELIDVDWNFGPVQRSPQAGLESISVTATARVDESENVNLAQRARHLCREGIELFPPSVDTAVPTFILRDVQAALRKKLLELALQEMRELNDVVAQNDGGKPFRLQGIEYSGLNADYSAKTMPPNSMRVGSTYAAADSAAGSMVASEKVTMTASVRLARTVL